MLYFVYITSEMTMLPSDHQIMVHAVYMAYLTGSVGCIKSLFLINSFVSDLS